MLYIFYSDLFLYTRILKTNVLTQFLSKKIPLELVSSCFKFTKVIFDLKFFLLKLYDTQKLFGIRKTRFE